MAKAPVRIFLDSNIILSGLFSSSGASYIILDILSLNLPFLIWVTGQYNILEIERNLARKMTGTVTLYQEYIKKLGIKIMPVPTQREMQKFVDANSDKNLPVHITAMLSKADFLVTGDVKGYSALNEHLNFPSKIVSPVEFTDRTFPDILKTFS